jgi:hypothetical protein
MSDFMPTPEEQKRYIQNAANNRELERQKMDPFEVYNPLDHDFVFMEDRFLQRVKAHETKSFPRYLARHYAKKIVEFMINEQIGLQGEALKKKREEQMGSKYLDKYVENVEIWDKVPKVNDPELVTEHTKMLRIRKLADYGMEPELQQEMPVGMPSFDDRNSYERAFDDIADASGVIGIPKVNVDSSVTEKPIEPPLYKSKATLAKEAEEMTKNE